MKKQPEIEKNASTEEKIKEAARRVFTQKGYAATRTRDIAEESGYNLALINYYFRSKEKLFDIIMLEMLQVFVHSIMHILNDEQTSLQEKVGQLIEHYIDMLKVNPDLPLFILNAANEDPNKLIERIGLDKEVSTRRPYIVKQWQEVAASGMRPKINPAHLVMNVIGMTIFPFVGRHMLKNRLQLSTEEFNELMDERKKLIPVWIKAILMSIPAQ